MRALLFSLAFMILTGCATTMVPRDIASEDPKSQVSIPEDLPAGGRLALHGMVVYGSGPYFLEHIPMVHQPHDFQIVAEVVLTDASGHELNNDFSATGFTLEPAHDFSLNDYLKQRFTGFNGAVFRGGFEQGGSIVDGLKNVHVEVKRFLFVRPLLPFQESQQVLFTMHDHKNTFTTNVISPSRNIQRIRNETAKSVLWCVKGPDFGPPCTP
jgi:hypothetical protein